MRVTQGGTRQGSGKAHAARDVASTRGGVRTAPKPRDGDALHWDAREPSEHALYRVAVPTAFARGANASWYRAVRRAAKDDAAVTLAVYDERKLPSHSVARGGALAKDAFVGEVTLTWEQLLTSTPVELALALGDGYDGCGGADGFADCHKPSYDSPQARPPHKPTGGNRGELIVRIETRALCEVFVGEATLFGAPRGGGSPSSPPPPPLRAARARLRSSSGDAPVRCGRDQSPWEESASGAAVASGAPAAPTRRPCWRESFEMLLPLTAPRDSSPRGAMRLDVVDDGGGGGGGGAATRELGGVQIAASHAELCQKLSRGISQLPLSQLPLRNDAAGAASEGAGGGGGGGAVGYVEVHVALSDFSHLKALGVLGFSTLGFPGSREAAVHLDVEAQDGAAS